MTSTATATATATAKPDREADAWPPIHDAPTHDTPQYRCAGCGGHRWRPWYDDAGEVQLACSDCVPTKETSGPLALLDHRALGGTLPPSFRVTESVDLTGRRCQRCNGRCWRLTTLVHQSDGGRIALCCDTCLPVPTPTAGDGGCQ